MAPSQILPFAVRELDVQVLRLAAAPVELLSNLAEPSECAARSRALDVVRKEGVDALAVSRLEGSVDRRMKALGEVQVGAPGGPLHLHDGVEEMFFVLSGTPSVRTPEREEQLSPGDVVYFPEGPDGLHTFSNPTTEPARVLGISTKRFPDVLAYPERGVACERSVPEGGDEGIIARFELPRGE